MEIMEFIWQNVGVGDEIELFSSVPLLHLDIVIAEAILASDFIALREMIDPLIFI